MNWGQSFKVLMQPHILRLNLDGFHGIRRCNLRIACSEPSSKSASTGDGKGRFGQVQRGREEGVSVNIIDVATSVYQPRLSGKQRDNSTLGNVNTIHLFDAKSSQYLQCCGSLSIIPEWDNKMDGTAAAFTFTVEDVDGVTLFHDNSVLYQQYEEGKHNVMLTSVYDPVQPN
ncbi:hypothetical protein M378DRAFT_17413 [Amanita muscaria Koide BX008]|uniref:Uncharacterized protein n=1 Tax=Amanita muscaria (strain Koide BX008) TaxID=946122 RepID=A0A0C2W4N4_AMAMK|nr:hypothetical protein M378DRAFT_17413 [Amanita muscaria Koide BX008]